MTKQQRMGGMAEVARAFKITRDCGQKVNNTLLNHNVPLSERRQMSL